jgi:hypothetical protein
MNSRAFWGMILGMLVVAAIGIAITLKTNTPAYATAIATFSAAFVALFKEDVVTLWRRPALGIRMLLKAPDCMPVPVVVTYAVTGGTNQWKGDCYFFRLWIQNDGSTCAERVQVYVKSVSRLMGDGSLEPLPDFAPMNLRWPHSPDPARPIIFETLNPHMGKHCDFGSVSPTTNPTETPRDGMDKGESTFNLQTEVFSNNEAHRLRVGRYSIKILVAASNAKPRQFTIRLDWNGRFEATATRMLSESVKVEIGEE